MKTKCFYEDGIWQAIVTHPNYNLGKRELDGLIRFLPRAAKKIKNVSNVLHLGVGNGREIEYFIKHLPKVDTYFINDICSALLKKTTDDARRKFSKIRFVGDNSDIELEGTIHDLAYRLSGSTLIALVANAVIFSNRMMDKNILEAMNYGVAGRTYIHDYFLLTLESYHDDIFKSYAIEPVYELLSRSGLKVTAETVEIVYEDQCLKMKYEGEILLSSYKPTVDQLRERMSSSGFTEIALQHYEDIHMIGALYKKR